MAEAEIIIRQYDPINDDPYIYSTWTRFCWYSAAEPIHLSKKKWFQQKALEIKQKLKLCKTHIACLKDDPECILGYIVGLPIGIEWLCVKKQFRNQGIEDLLIRSLGFKENKNE